MVVEVVSGGSWYSSSASFQNYDLTLHSKPCLPHPVPACMIDITKVCVGVHLNTLGGDYYRLTATHYNQFSLLPSLAPSVTVSLSHSHRYTTYLTLHFKNSISSSRKHVAYFEYVNYSNKNTLTWDLFYVLRMKLNFIYR